MLVPFDLTTIDSHNQDVVDKRFEGMSNLIKRLINIGRTYICLQGKLKDGAAVMLSKLLTRSDVVKSGETDLFLTQMCMEYQSSKDDSKEMFKVAGVLQTLVEIFKTGHRVDLLPRINTIFDPILKTGVTNSFM